MPEALERYLKALRKDTFSIINLLVKVYNSRTTSCRWTRTFSVDLHEASENREKIHGLAQPTRRSFEPYLRGASLDQSIPTWHTYLVKGLVSSTSVNCTKNMNKAFVTEFVEVYRSNPALWKIKSFYYINKNFKNKGYTTFTEVWPEWILIY